MPLNLPTIDRDSISFGPGRLFLGAAGTTPTTDVGAITEDGITVEFASEKLPSQAEVARCAAKSAGRC